MVNATENPTKTVAELIRTEMFLYAKSNMALVNVYINPILDGLWNYVTGGGGGHYGPDGF